MEDLRAASEWENDGWTEEDDEDIDLENEFRKWLCKPLPGLSFPASVLNGDSFWIIDWPGNGDTDGQKE